MELSQVERQKWEQLKEDKNTYENLEKNLKD